MADSDVRHSAAESRKRRTDSRAAYVVGWRWRRAGSSESSVALAARRPTPSHTSCGTLGVTLQTSIRCGSRRLRRRYQRARADSLLPRRPCPPPPDDLASVSSVIDLNQSSSSRLTTMSNPATSSSSNAANALAKGGVAVITGAACVCHVRPTMVPLELSRALMSPRPDHLVVWPPCAALGESSTQTSPSRASHP
jgi:hypothetical protein